MRAPTDPATGSSAVARFLLGWQAFWWAAALVMALLGVTTRSGELGYGAVMAGLVASISTVAIVLGGRRDRRRAHWLAHHRPHALALESARLLPAGVAALRLSGGGRGGLRVCVVVSRAGLELVERRTFAPLADIPWSHVRGVVDVRYLGPSSGTNFTLVRRHEPKIAMWELGTAIQGAVDTYAGR